MVLRTRTQGVALAIYTDEPEHQYSGERFYFPDGECVITVFLRKNAESDDLFSVHEIGVWPKGLPPDRSEVPSKALLAEDVDKVDLEEMLKQKSTQNSQNKDYRER